MTPRLFALALVVALSACGSSAPDVITASYTISGGTVMCHGASDTSEFQSAGYHTYDCIWFCATYQDNVRAYVDLTFRDTGTSWVLDSTYVSSGICN